MATVAKKAPATGRETPTGAPRPTPRATTPSSAGSPGGGGLARTRSTRAGTPVSARAAAHQRRESIMGNGTAANGKRNSSPDVARDEAIRAEMVVIIDDLRERLAQAESSSETNKRQVEVLQSKLDDALQEQAKLEEKVHESEEQIEALSNEKRDAARQMREMETIYEAERSAMTNEKEDFANREEEMQTIIQRLKDSLAQRNLDEDRPTRQSVSSSPSIDSGSFAPPSSINRSDSRNNSKLVLQKDKLIESLRLELAESQIKLVESQNQGGGRLQEVERLLMEARVANARLMEDNESYQLLLHERTLKGDFAINDFSYSGSASANQDALAALEGRGLGTSLADELSGAGDDHDHETQRRLETELRLVRDQNKALTLYINKLIERLLQHQGFEHILDQTSDFSAGTGAPDTNKELPPPPAPKTAPGASILQRAKSMAIGGTVPTTSTTTRPRPRPKTSISSSTPSALSNPDTAPSIPIGLGRSASTRRARPMSEQYTSGSAASIVNAMYKGDGGPLSPSLRQSQASLFSQAHHSTSGSTSGSNQSGTPGSRSSGNFPGMRSETSSTSGDSIELSTQGSITHSPPRVAHEKSTTFAGNKPRPLRLVQENAEAQAAERNAKRQSWVGWVGSAFAKKEDGTGGEVIRE
ncbi:hypothetical protein BT67DRAFT_413825 [Trichocladium antarcticum]|uniref:M protein, serotype 2.1 n=1 Tax=Trichocladium antarcticum TaxID=1450529 RepID=A0AAN6UTH4_9PEZI|nr:hypothetical protein BT67DRAFT_413825 [Trichocladium antarcticum]